MNILLMHRNDGLAAGAQVQMNRLLGGLRRAGVDARVLCREGDPEDAVLMPYQPRVESFLWKLTRRTGLHELHLVSSFQVPQLDAVKEADLIDLHCLHSGTFSYMALPVLTASKPVVFTFHDMWPLTGHCHASVECERWKTGCGKCPHLETYPAVPRDWTAIEWLLKARAYKRSKFTIVTPSKWLAARVGESMLSDFPVHHIPHGLDMKVFRPMSREQCRRILGIPDDKIVLLCVIEMDRPLKGAALLAQAIQLLPAPLRQKCALAVVGHSNYHLLKSISMPVVDLGYIMHDSLKALVYSAADLLINPTRAESFGLVSLESIACGTPVAAFAVGGVPEIVRPGLTGALAEPENPLSLAEEIERLIGNTPQLEALRKSCRQVAVRDFSLEKQVEQYIELYRHVISGDEMFQLVRESAELDAEFAQL